MGVPARQRLSPYEYFEIEAESSIKHEYLDGLAWAMAGGTPNHSAIATRILSLLDRQLEGRPCQVFDSNLRITVASTGLRTYPDGSVVCGRLERDPDDHTRTSVTNPKLLIEVLSASTEAYDRGEKLENYKQIPTLEEVLLVAQSERLIEVVRREGGDWVRHQTRAGVARIRSLGCELAVDEVYRSRLPE
jgi:Uma2 family endonuclease